MPPGLGAHQMRRLGCIGLLAFISLLNAGAAWGSCDFVRHWDDRTLSACIDELSNELSVLRLELQAVHRTNEGSPARWRLAS